MMPCRPDGILITMLFMSERWRDGSANTNPNDESFHNHRNGANCEGAATRHAAREAENMAADGNTDRNTDRNTHARMHARTHARTRNRTVTHALSLARKHEKHSIGDIDM